MTTNPKQTENPPPSEQVAVKKPEDNSKVYLREKLLAVERSTADERVSRFFDVAIGDTLKFFVSIFGTSYTAKNDFSYPQKKNILNYLYVKNDADMSDYNKENRFAVSEPQIKDISTSTDLEALYRRLRFLERVKHHNRIFLISEVGLTQDRIRMTGFIWGTVVACLASMAMRKANIIKKAALSLTIFHLSGQFATLRVIDRVFDGLYPFFVADVKEFMKEEAQRPKDTLVARSTIGQKDSTEIAIENAFNRIGVGERVPFNISKKTEK
eukprot:TRINITY_DN4308_c0_g1_i1.p1 TRINITY_DN4308_c0_g1~~TRINITY_DN4308_c0_g1_i1.p1  ORF type:complete len:269 (-),score=44.02 TRINITY_DN4308_c0_g1_i1:83-889(-)